MPFFEFWSLWDDFAYVWNKCASAAVNLLIIAAVVWSFVRFRRWKREPSFATFTAMLRENANGTIIGTALLAAVLLHALTTRFFYVKDGHGDVVAGDRWTGTVEPYGRR
jgi:hypothetical protein